MARFCGIVGFEIEQAEVAPGIWEPTGIEERQYFGNIPKNNRKWSSVSNSTNDDLTLSNRISIVCDNYMLNNWPAIKYVKLNGVCWKVDSAEIARPRIILTLGGVWNGVTRESP